jgi:hypothetical protein
VSFHVEILLRLICISFARVRMVLFHGCCGYIEPTRTAKNTRVRALSGVELDSSATTDRRFRNAAEAVTLLLL